MNDKYERLMTLLAEVRDIERALALLWWDRQALMPPGGAEERSNQIATISKIYHTKFTSDEIGRLLNDLSSEMADLDPDSDEARIIKVTRHDFDMECKLPERLVEETARASSAGLEAWQKARAAKSFAMFAPYLQRNAELTREAANAYGYEDRPYDAFLGIVEPGITTAQLETIFSELKEAIVPMVREVAARQDKTDDSCLHQPFDEHKQMDISLKIAQQYGYDLNRGRLDKSPHPFATSFGVGDVRITTRVYPNFLNACLFATLHESGHAMYEQGISPALSRTPLGQGASGGVHESQSRLWENLVGRSRPFQNYLFPRLQETFPEQLGNVDIEAFYRAVNKVHPSLIRVEADEVTYNLHILLRFELENEMLEDRVDISKMDQIWRERIERYLGIVPEDDAVGVLQDIHWSSAGMYIFPSYTLGNVIGAQLFKQARKDMPDLNEQISRGEFADLLGWLRTNVYQHGRKFTPNELVQRITGQPVGTAAWIEYARGKFSELYGL
ncbi:MAG TPA: carboxypeptidase M32 [Chloroflexia bacterium]|nr:carboxypeptidase M32 [Chloroflexia bacterium]